jgi:hypothetical protein
MSSPRSATLAVAAALLSLALASTPAAAARTGVTVKLKRAGSLGKAASAVLVVDAGTTEVVAGGALRSRPVARLTPPAGVFMAVAAVARTKGGPRVGVSDPFAFADGGRVTLELKLAPEAPAGAHAALAPAPGAVGANDVATMNDVTITDGKTGASLSLAAPYLTVLFNLTQEKCKLRWVERSTTFLQARERELQLQREGRLDPSTPIVDDPLSPTVHVEGELVATKRQVMGELRLVDDETSEVLVRYTVNGKYKKLEQLIISTAAGFADLICADEPTPPGLTVEIRGLPTGIKWSIVDQYPPPEGPRIDCPGKCFYPAPDGHHGIISLKSIPVEDPRTGDFPFDIESITGCKGTSALPASNGGLCYLNGDESKVVVNLRYRPILAVTFAGEAGTNPVVTGNPTTGYSTDGTGFACYASSPTTQTCARHYSVGGPIDLQTASYDGDAYDTELVSWDGPCAGKGIGPGTNKCTLSIVDDTCITATFRKHMGTLGTAHAISGPACPTGAMTP